MRRMIDKKLWIWVVLAGMVFNYACGGKSSKSANEMTGEKNVRKQKTNRANDMQTFREAALNGQVQVIRDMLPGVQDVDETDENGNTALMLAGYNGHTEIVKLLLDRGADINHLNSDGRNVLMYTASGPYPETVELLLERGAEIDRADKAEHFTALMWAAAEGNMDVVKVLLRHGADASLKDVDGDTAASFARKNKHDQVADYIDHYKQGLLKNPE